MILEFCFVVQKVPDERTDGAGTHCVLGGQVFCSISYGPRKDLKKANGHAVSSYLMCWRHSDARKLISVELGGTSFLTNQMKGREPKKKKFVGNEHQTYK